MHQHSAAADVIGVVPFDLKVVGRLRMLTQLVLDLLDYHIFAVEQLKPVAGPQMTRLCPAFDGNPERMIGCADYLLVIDGEDMKSLQNVH